MLVRAYDFYDEVLRIVKYQAADLVMCDEPHKTKKPKKIHVNDKEKIDENKNIEVPIGKFIQISLRRVKTR